MAQNVVLIRALAMRNWTKMPFGFAQKVRFRLEKRRSATEPEPVEFAFQFYTHDLYTFGQKPAHSFYTKWIILKRPSQTNPPTKSSVITLCLAWPFYICHAKNPQTKVRGSNFAQDVEYCQKIRNAH